MTKTSTDAQIVGSVSFINGDAQQFTDAKEYLDCIREELPHEATTGFPIPYNHAGPSRSQGGR